jgi:uncharacterized protein YjbJ (UPF0337 family)
VSWDVIERNWRALKGKVLAEWDNLSVDAFDEIVGKHDRLIARIQEAYGISRQEAERQVESFEKANQDYRPPDAS